MPLQRGFVEHNQIVQALAAYRANDPFDIGPLLRCSRSSEHFANTELFHLLREIGTEDAVTVPQ